MSFRCMHITCGLLFAEESKLVDHLQRAHKGERARFNFGCDRCGQPFQTSVGLEVHLKDAHGIVAEIDPVPEAWRCRHCPKRCSSAHGLWLHSKRIHGDPEQGKRKFTPPARGAA